MLLNGYCVLGEKRSKKKEEEEKVAEMLREGIRVRCRSRQSRPLGQSVLLSVDTRQIKAQLFR